MVERKYIDNIDNNNSIIDEEISEAPKSTSRARQKKEKIVTDKYAGIKWQKEPPIGGMKKRLLSGVPGISAAVTTENPIDIFELMITLCKKCPYSELFWSVFYRIWTEYGEILRISPYSVRMRENTKQNSSEYGHFLRDVTDELLEIIVEQTNLNFQQNLVGSYKPSRIIRYLESKHARQFSQNDICLYLLYRGVFHKPIYHVNYTNDKIYKIPGFRKFISQNKLVFIEKYIHFVDISESGESYNRSSKIPPIHKYIVERWQSFLTLGSDISIDKTLHL